MLLEVLEWPESQEVMDKPDWFLVMGGDNLNDSCYAKILSEEEIIDIANKIQDERTAYASCRKQTKKE